MEEISDHRFPETPRVLTRNPGKAGLLGANVEVKAGDQG
jgi:hypothetical protein